MERKLKIKTEYPRYCKFTCRYQVVWTATHSKTWTYKNYNKAVERYQDISSKKTGYIELRRTEWLKDARGKIIRKDVTVIDWK